MKQIKLSFTEDYVSHWSWWQGARELMQNAIDTKDFDIIFGENNIDIISRGGAIPTRALLLGATTKRDDSSTIGKFGEGMKLGFLVLLREGANIVMENGLDTWYPKIVRDDAYDANVLAVDVEYENLPHADENTVTIKITCIPDWAMDEIRDNYAPTTHRHVVIENDRGKAYTKLLDVEDYEDGEDEASVSDTGGGPCNEQVAIATNGGNDAKFIAAANPANILSLLAERTADKALIAQLRESNRILAADGIVKQDRIAELEARTVSVKLPPASLAELNDSVEPVWPACSVTAACEDAGIKLEVGE